MNRTIKARINWVQAYEKKQDAGYVCRYFAISRPTLRKWYKRYKELGIKGLSNQSTRPHCSPNKKITSEIKKWIVNFRNQRNLGVRRIQTELIRLH